MATVKKPRAKKMYTPAEANAMLPLLRSILRDITELACDLRQREERLRKVRVPAGGGDAYGEEMARVHADFERDQQRLGEYIDELKKLKVILKDPFMGLIDFPCLLNGREVYLCWRLGEEEVAFWHETNSGFAGRKKIGEVSPQRHRDAEKREGE
jgi:hypothetical protein